MKISTVPFLPRSVARECDAPPVSGSEKSAMVEPMIGGAGMSTSVVRALATNASASTKDSREKEANFFMAINPPKGDELGLRTGKRKRKVNRLGWEGQLATE